MNTRKVNGSENSTVNKEAGFKICAFFVVTIAFNMWQLTRLLNIEGVVRIRSNSTIAKDNELSQREHETNAEHEKNRSHPIDSKIFFPIDPQARLCSREEILDGLWVSSVMASPPYFPKNPHLRCYPDDAYKTRWKTYQWRPRDSPCSFGSWNQTEFCSLMVYTTVLIAGDSLSWEHFSSLGQLLGLRVHQSTQHSSKANQQNHVQFACHQRTRLAFRRDDTLENLGSALEETFPQVLVINRGAHYQNDSRLLTGIEKNIEEIKVWKDKCKSYGVKCHLFWRTSVPGHPLCDRMNFTRPYNDLTLMEAWISNKSNYDDRTIKYHWDDYQRQNVLVIDKLRHDLGDDGLEILDGYYLNVLRPDEHRAHQGDCLHNCYPGKMDVYSQLLLHYLKVQRTQEDVDRLTDLLAQAHSVVKANASRASELKI